MTASAAVSRILHIVLSATTLAAAGSPLPAQEPARTPPAGDTARPPVPEALRGTARLVGRVVAAETGEALAEALVALPRAGVGTLTDATGYFALEGLDPGTETVEVRYLGRRSSPVEVELAPGQLSLLELALAVDPVTLEDLEVTVTARERRRGKMAGFYERMEYGLGEFFTRDEIERYAPTGRLSDLFRQARNFSVEPCRRIGSCFELVNRRRSRGLGASGCKPRIFLDGALVFLDRDNGGLNTIPLQDIEAVELYGGPATMPAQYMGSDSGCGVVLLWTR